MSVISKMRNTFNKISLVYRHLDCYRQRILPKQLLFDADDETCRHLSDNTRIASILEGASPFGSFFPWSNALEVMYEWRMLKTFFYCYNARKDPKNRKRYGNMLSERILTKLIPIDQYSKECFENI